MQNVCLQDNVEMMTELLQDFEDINKQLDSTGKTLLNIAIERGAVKCVEKLLDMKADPNQWDSCEQVTAMHSVAMAATNIEELLELLRRSGGDINSGVARSGCSVLHAAVRHNNLRMVRYLLDHRYSGKQTFAKFKISLLGPSPN